MVKATSPTNEPQGDRMVGSAISLLWMVVHSVQGIGLKDLKQILRKEQVTIFTSCILQFLFVTCCYSAYMMMNTI